jgi:hypothetical protein
MKAPAFSLDYFPSREVAWSLFRDPKVVIRGPATPVGLRSAGSWDYFDSRIGTYGSTGSSNGPWVGDVTPSGQQTPFSTGNTPPIIPSHRSHRNSNANSFSTSPEQQLQQLQLRTTRRSNSNLSAALSSLSRPFAIISSSPSANDRFRIDGDLSTSAPATAITWGSTTFYSGSSSLSPDKRRRSSGKRGSFAGHDSTYSSSDGSDIDFSDYSDDEPLIRPLIKQPNAPIIKVTLKYQHLFDDESHASVPLLPPEHEAKYAAYRDIYAEQLSVWGLYIQRAEILKFNGLTNYWPTKMSSEQQPQQAGSSSNTPAAGSSTLPAQDTFPAPLTSDSDILLREQHMQIVAAQAADPVGWADTFIKVVEHPNKYIDLEANKISDEELLRHGKDRNKMLEKPDILRREQLPGEAPLDTTERLRTSCRMCRERIKGIFLVCPTGIHRVHWECHQNMTGGRPGPMYYLEYGRGVPIGCDCPTPPGHNPGSNPFMPDSNALDRY